MANVAVVLAGCGFKDGSEIHEATLTLLALSQAGATYRCFAPDRDIVGVTNHVTGSSTDEQRNLLVEAGRIARGDISPLSALQADAFDALIFPGGFGAAMHLSNWAQQGPNAVVDDHVKRVISAFHSAAKPLGFICIAPNLGALVLGAKGVKLTIGNDPGTAAGIEKTGAVHVKCAVDDIIVDETHKVVSTPAYMLGPTIADVHRGIDKLVQKVLSMA